MVLLQRDATKRKTVLVGCIYSTRGKSKSCCNSGPRNVRPCLWENILVTRILLLQRDPTKRKTLFVGKYITKAKSRRCLNVYFSPLIGRHATKRNLLHVHQCCCCNGTPRNVRLYVSGCPGGVWKFTFRFASAPEGGKVKVAPTFTFRPNGAYPINIIYMYAIGHGYITLYILYQGEK